MNDATARARKVAFWFGIVAGALLVVSSAVRRDDVQLRQSNPQGIPLHLLPDEKVVESYRSIGYVSAILSQSQLDSLFSSMLDQKMTPTLAYLREELERYMRLISEAFHTPSTRAFYDAVLKNQDTQRLYYEMNRRQRRYSNAIYQDKRLSPDIPRMIEANISDLNRLGLADWAGFDYETCAGYYAAIAQEDKANDCRRKALACYVANGDMPLASLSAGKIGIYLLRTGDWEQSERFLLASLKYAREAGDKLFLSRALYSFARLRASQGYFAEAESLLVRSVDYCRAIADPTTEISELVGLAELYIDFGEYSRAGSLVERAIFQTQTNLADPAVASNMNLRHNMVQFLAEGFSSQAEIQYERKLYGAAMGSVRKALTYADETRYARLTADLLRRLGDINAARGDSEDAFRCYSQALHLARKRHDASSEAEYLSALGGLSLDARQFDKAERYFTEALGLNPDTSSWVQEAEIMRRLAETKIGLHEYASAKRLCGQALRSLRSNLAEKRFEGTRHAGRATLDSICIDLLALESDHFYNCDSLIFTAEKTRQLRIGAAGIRNRNLDEDIRHCMEHRDWIPENALIVQYLVTPDKTIIIAMDRYGATYRSIRILNERLMGEVAAFIAACGALSRSGDASTATREASIADGARSLYRILLEPLSTLIADRDVLCLMPDEALANLPFGALIVPGSQPRFLVEEKRILASPNLLMLKSGSTAQPEDDRRALYPSPVLVGQAEVSPLLRRLYPGLSTLPQTQAEVAAISELVPSATVLVGRDAAKQTVLARMRRAGLIHIATHTVQYPAYGGRPALLLSAAETGPEGETIGASLLTEDEIAGTDLSSAKLAVISSCESAIGREAERPHGFGIGGAFLEAGARTVIATLWPIEDTAARTFATVLYEELLRAGADPAHALPRADHRILVEDRAAGDLFRRIHVWGPFTLLGSF